MFLCALAALPALLWSCRDTLAPWPDRAPLAPRYVTVTDTVFPLADTYIRQTLPNTNWGADTALQVGGGGRNRVLVRFDSTAIRSAVGAGTLDSAWVEFTIRSFPQSGWGEAGRAVDLHRLLRTWTEGGATWNCAIDGEPLNTVADCPTTAWDMLNNANGTYVGTKTDRVTLVNNQTGTIRLNVTADVLGFLAGGSTHQGWMFRKTNEATGGEALVLSRESGSRPRLVLHVSGIDTAPPPVPDTMGLPTVNALLVQSTRNPNYTYFRDVFGVRFDSTASGALITAFFSKFNARIVGGVAAGTPLAMYFIQVQDPGSSFAAVDSLEAAMRAEPGVAHAMKVAFKAPTRLRGRFPLDSAVATHRSSWVAPGNAATQPWIAIRAPLAWGCETGTYAVSRPRIGVIDKNFDSIPFDLGAGDGTVVRRWLPPQLMQDPVNAAIGRNHGPGVASIIAARGDNGRGMAGMVWGARLDLFAFETGQTVAVAEVPYLTKVFAAAAQANVRVLNISLAIGDVTDSAQQLEIAAGLKHYLAPGADRLLVLAAGNRGQNLTLASLASATDTNLSALDRAAATIALGVPFAHRIMFVTGASRSGAHLTGTNIWTGADMIAAPAERIPTLADESDRLVLQDSSSIAAPFVTGLAAQLWAMDSTLTAPQVVDYILRGAMAPKIDPTTGNTVPAVPVVGGSGVFLLDAYSSLSLLSSERSGTPVCGFDVRFENGAVVLDRPAGREVFSMSGHPDRSVSVAQGGRRIAVGQSIYNTDPDPAWQGVTVIDQTGATLHTLANVTRRLYLERDTVDVRYGPSADPRYQTGEPRLDLTGPGRTFADLDRAILAPFVSGDQFFAGWLEVSPDARYVAAPMWDNTTVSCPAGGASTIGTNTMRLIPLDGSPSLSVYASSVNYCGSSIPVDEYAGNDQAAFSHDGSRAAFGVAFLDGDPQAQGNDHIRSRLYNILLGVGAPAVTVVEGRYVQGLRFEAGDVLVFGQDFDGGFPSPPPGGPCLGVARRATALGTTVGNPVSLPVGDCLLVQGGITRGNLRSYRAASRRPGMPPSWRFPVPRKHPAVGGNQLRVR